MIFEFEEGDLIEPEQINTSFGTDRTIFFSAANRRLAANMCEVFKLGGNMFTEDFIENLIVTREMIEGVLACMESWGLVGRSEYAGAEKVHLLMTPDKEDLEVEEAYLILTPRANEIEKMAVVVLQQYEYRQRMKDGEA
jgi:hypothetical protein